MGTDFPGLRMTGTVSYPETRLIWGERGENGEINGDKEPRKTITIRMPTKIPMNDGFIAVGPTKRRLAGNPNWWSPCSKKRDQRALRNGLVQRSRRRYKIPKTVSMASFLDPGADPRENTAGLTTYEKIT